MAKPTPDDIVAIAEKSGLESPRVLIRKQADNQIVYVLRHGPSDARQEIVKPKASSPGEWQATCSLCRPSAD